jgi:hypothetical protein
VTAAVIKIAIYAMVVLAGTAMTLVLAVMGMAATANTTAAAGQRVVFVVVLGWAVTLVGSALFLACGRPVVAIAVGAIPVAVGVGLWVWLLLSELAR